MVEPSIKPLLPPCPHYTDESGQRWACPTFTIELGLRFPRDLSREGLEAVRQFIRAEIETLLINSYTGTLLPWQLDGLLSYLNISLKERE